MTFPTTPILDSFDSGANQSLSSRAGWLPSTRVIGYSDFTTDAVPTKAVAGGGGSNGDNVWGTQYTNVEVYAPITDWPGTAGSFYLAARWGTSASFNGYLLHLFSGTLIVDRYIAGSGVNIINLATSVGVGDSIGIECIGSQISAYTKIGAGAWTLFGTVVDATFPGPGNIGVVCDSAGNSIGSFGGGEVVVPPNIRRVAGWQVRSGGR